jgi:hypothetical protein
MVFHDECACWSQFALMKRRQHSTNIGAATDGLQGPGCGFLADARLQLLPHALGRGRERLRVGLFRAEFGDRLIQASVLL